MSAVQQEVIQAADIAAARDKRVSLVEKMADKYHLDPRNMMATLKATAFKGDVSNEQMAALLIVADAHNLNPWLKEIYAFPSRQGIVPIVGVDGWARIINEHPNFDGMDFKLEGKGDEAAYTCTIHRKDRAHPVSVTEYMTECYRPTDPWKTHPLRMLRHKSMIQCARLAFSFAGIYDPDEGERVLAADAINVTPEDGEMTRGEVGQAKRVSSKRLKEVVDAYSKAVSDNDPAAVVKLEATMDNEERLYIWGKMRSYERTPVTKLLEIAKKTGAGHDLNPWSLALIAKCATPDALQEAWTTIQDAYSDSDSGVPADVETVYQDRKAELGA